MTLKQLLDLGPDDWEKLSDEDLKKYLDPYLKVTRPTREQVVRGAAKSKSEAKKSTNLSSQQLIMQLQNLAKQQGITAK